MPHCSVVDGRRLKALFRPHADSTGSCEVRQDLHDDLKCCAHAAAAAACTSGNRLQPYTPVQGSRVALIIQLRLLTSDQGVVSPIAGQIGIILPAAVAQESVAAARREPGALRAVPLENNTVTMPL
jgi:hypothetical protein